MSDYVTDEMAEAAARALHAETCCPCDLNGCDYPSDLEGERAVALTVLTAAAPLIAAQALRDAADAWQWGEWAAITEPAKRPEQVPRILSIADAVTDWLRARADRIEKEGL